jgi:hypothetical protein
MTGMEIVVAIAAFVFGWIGGSEWASGRWSR